MPSSSRLKCHFGCEIDGPLHRFPKPQYPHLTKFNSWKSVLAKDVQDKGDIYIYNQIRICDRHFEKCYHSQSHRLIANAVPTLNIGFSQQQPVEIEVDENMLTLMQPLTSAQMTKVQQSSHSFPNLTVSMPSTTRNVANKAETNQSRRDSEDQDSADTSSQQVESLRRLQSTGAPIKKPKQEHRCHTCEEEISDWDELEKHLIQHVSLPSTRFEELPLEYSPPSGNENWSDEDEEPAAVNKLSGLGFTIKKNSMRIKQEPGYNATPESDDLQNINNRRQIKLEQTMETVKVKQEVENDEYQPQQNLPLFSGQIKTERSVTPSLDRNNCYTPLIAIVKDDPDGSANQPSQPIFSDSKTGPTSAMVPLLPVTKIEDTGPTFIEINIDSNDKDEDDCAVSTTPAPDIKPIVPKMENAPLVSCPSISQSFQSSQPSYNNSGHLSPRITTAPSLEKQHNFNWNAPDSKPHLNSMNILDNTADEIFQSLIANSAKKENLSLSEASEYVSLDTLGPQHTCDVCNTRFTDISLLDNHKRMTGHTRSLITPSSSTLMPYAQNSNILSSLLPVKHLADQVGKLSSIGGSGPGFTHQQNVMINIQAYPGGNGVMGQAPPLYNYSSGQTMGSPFSQTSSNMYSAPGPQQMPGQYPGQNTYMGQQGYGQFPTSMPNSTYPGTKTENSYSAASSQYSTASPLQSMQQAVYGQSSGLMNTQGQMGPPGSIPYIPSSSPSGSMKPPQNTAIKIQNVQTFPANQMMGMSGQAGSTEMPPPQQPQHQMQQQQQPTPGHAINQMPPPGQIRMAPGAQLVNMRPRMPTVRGQRPSIRPGIQVHGQVRGVKPGTRMPLKRPGNMGPAPTMKKRPNMLLPDKHDNEDCQVMAMQKQREGLPMIHSVQGAKDKIGSQISITKKTVNKEANAMANVLASRGISIKQKQKSRSPTPERPIPHIPNLGAGVSIKHTSKTSSFSIPEAKVGGGMLSCKICKKMFMNHNSLAVHMTNAHPQCKLPIFKCDECPSSYPKLLQLQHHKRVFHNVTGPNREVGIPVVDLSQEDNLKRLGNLGIYSFIPLANREQDNGCFGIPVVSVHNMQNGLTSSLQALGADGLLSLGPLKPLPNA